MGIKFLELTQSYKVSYSKRHPITRKPISLSRIRNNNGDLIKTMVEAKRILNELVLQMDKSFRPAEVGKMNYADLLSKFYVSLHERDLSKATIDNYRSCLDAHTYELWKYREIDSILPDEIRSLIRIKLADKSKSHQKSILKFVRGVFNYAVESGFLMRSPVPFMQFRIGNKFKPVLNETQAKILLEKAQAYDHEWYPHWSMALYTGMRNEELYALTWDNVNFENRLIYVRNVWTKKDGFKDLTKSGNDRAVEIATPLLILLKELRLKTPEVPFVLPRLHEWDGGRQAECLRMFLTGLNLPQISFHNLRATWATLLLSKGVEPIKVMKMGGWSSLKTLERHYIRLSGVDIRGATDALNLHDATKMEAKILKMNPCIEM